MRKSTRLMLAGLSAIAVSYGFARYEFGLFVPVFREEFRVSTQQIGVVSSASYAAYLVAMILTGFLTNRRGPRIAVVTGSLCASLGMLLIATAQAPVPLIIGVILAGSSPGFCWAPFSDAIAMMVDPKHRNRVLSVVSSGTTFGLVVAGPVAIMADTGGGTNTSAWRFAWASFAIAALLVAVWNARLLPSLPYEGSVPSISDGAGTRNVSFSWFLCRKSIPLLGQAFLYGLIAAFYFTYAVDLVRGAGLSETWAAVLWSLVGLGGIAGLFGGDAVYRFGLNRCLTVCLGLLAVSIASLTFGEESITVVVIGALMFGASYMPMAAFLVIWSGYVFHERPTTGFSAVLFCLAFGAIVGPVSLGSIADTFGLKTAFWCTAALTGLIPVLRPHADLHGPTSELAHRAETGKLEVTA